MCPARLILLPAGSAAELAGERIAMVYASPAAAESAQPLADRLGARVGVVPELQEVPGESGTDAVRRCNAALGGIADLHRGESAAVVTQVSLGFPLGPEPVELEHDGDAWSMVPDPNAVTLAAYEQRAERFRATRRPGPRPGHVSLIDLVSAELAPGSRVLEVGGGTGADALELGQRGYRVRRTDGAAAFVDMMRADGQAADQLNLLTDDLGGPYDLVFANAVFLHFSAEQLRGILLKAARAAPLLAFTVREGEGAQWSTRHLDLPRHFTLWQEEPLRRLLDGTGWTPLSVSRGETPVGGWLTVLARSSSDSTVTPDA